MNNCNDHSQADACGSEKTLNCKQLDSFLVDYVDNKLTPDQRHAFEEHIRLCAACVEYVEDYKLAISLGKESFDKETDECAELIPDQLVSAILKASKS